MPKGLYLYLAIFFLTSFSTLNAKESNAKEAESTGDLKTEIKAYILHHLPPPPAIHPLPRAQRTPVSLPKASYADTRTERQTDR